jgi:hypothetical protein
LIDNIIHAFEVLKTLDIVLRDTHIVEGLGSQLVPLVEPIDTTSEQTIDDLVARVKHVVLGFKIWFSKGG